MSLYFSCLSIECLYSEPDSFRFNIVLPYFSVPSSLTCTASFFILTLCISLFMLMHLVFVMFNSCSLIAVLECWIVSAWIIQADVHVNICFFHVYLFLELKSGEEYGEAECCLPDEMYKWLLCNDDYCYYNTFLIHRTDDIIQKTVRAKFMESTVLTIAHQLQKVMDCDRIMVSGVKLCKFSFEDSWWTTCRSYIIL